jgi:RNA-directed DNA polymerase
MNSKHLARALADAMLSGPPDPGAVHARCAEALGTDRRWLRDLAKAMVTRYGGRWRVEQRDSLALSIRNHPSIENAIRSREPLKVHRYFFLTPKMGVRPDALEHCEIPALPTSADLARWLGIGVDELAWLARLGLPVRSSHYVYRWVPKRSVGWRLIEMPKARLREVQRRLLHGLLDKVPPHRSVHGFRSGHSVCTHAQGHVGQRIVVRMDLQDFFLTIRGARINTMFRTLGYPAEVARLLMGLCANHVPATAIIANASADCADDRPPTDWTTRKRYGDWHLPQGAPTSPSLANLASFPFDVRLQSLAETFQAHYTRYADDLTFSGGDELRRRIDRFIPYVGAIAIEEGLRVNYRKTRVMSQAQRQLVTGVVVNQKLNVSRDVYDRLKATLHNCVQRGPHNENCQAVPNFQAHLSGRVAHVSMLNPARGQRLQALLERIDWGP